MAQPVTGQAQGIIFAVSQKAGQASAFSTGWHNDLIASELLPRYAYLNLAGTVFSATNAGGGQTLVAANLFSTAIATWQPIHLLNNPAGNSKNFVILQAWCGISSDTLATDAQTGAFLWVVSSGVPVLTNSASVTPINCSTLKATGSSALVVNNAALTAAVTLPANSVLRPVTASISQVTATANVAAIINPFIMEEVAGSIIVPPGSYAAFANGISATVGAVNAGMVWAELPL